MCQIGFRVGGSEFLVPSSWFRVGVQEICRRRPISGRIHRPELGTRNQEAGTRNRLTRLPAQARHGVVLRRGIGRAWESDR
jgi:hypothetical protein